MNNPNRNERILDFFTEQHIQGKVEEILSNIGVPHDKAGYSYLKEAVIKVYLNNSYLIKGLTSRLYPEIAQKHNVKWQNVESQIRRVIEFAFEFGDVELQIEVFKKEYTYKNERPTNRYAIECLVEYLNKTL